MKQPELLQQMLQEHNSVSKDILSLKLRLKSDDMDNQQRLTNHRFLLQAIVMRKELENTINAVFTNPLSQINLWPEIKLAN
ncbi:MAG: hypothetical protein EOO88_42530 [Pedobacter sp.]|nr:MAG: hypothetical protein EOO88_42530 [Pedobacter sp.]